MPGVSEEIKEKIIASYIASPEGREKLAHSLYEPLKLWVQEIKEGKRIEPSGTTDTLGLYHRLMAVSSEKEKATEAFVKVRELFAQLSV